MNPDRHPADSRPSTELLLRREQLVAELEALNRRVGAILNHRPDPSIPVTNRVRLFLSEHQDMTFKVKELAEAVVASEDTVRKALSYLTNNGFLIRSHVGVYGIDPYKGPLDWDSARVLRGWEDP